EALGDVVREARVVDADDLAGAVAGELLGSGRRIRAQNQNIERGDGGRRLLGERDGRQRASLERAIFGDFCNDECFAHGAVLPEVLQITRASVLSFSTSSAALLTMTPALRASGSANLP